MFEGGDCMSNKTVESLEPISDYVVSSVLNNWHPDKLSAESKQSYHKRLKEGFFNKYLKGMVLDIGYRGYENWETVPVVPNAIGIDLNYPGYDGKTLPFSDESVDSVYASHTLEHLEDYKWYIRDWFRVLKINGFLIISVPHRDLYEKRKHLPSRWNADHKRFYTPSSLLAEIEESIEPNSYRIRSLCDNDENFNYSIDPYSHSAGCYEIELVIQKIKKPSWNIINEYEFRTLDSNVNTKSIIDKIEIFLNFEREYKNNKSLFVSKMILLIEGLEKLSNHYTAVKQGTIKNLKELVITLSKENSVENNDKLSKSYEIIKEELEILKERLLK